MNAVSAKLQGLATWLKNKGFDRESLAIVRLASHEKELIEQYPQFTKEIEQASRSGVKPGHLVWVVEQLERKEPIAEIISTIKEFNRFHSVLPQKDLYQYATLGELRGAIEALDSKTQQRKKHRQNLEGNYEIIYEDEYFLVIHPHNQEASCHFGQGTRWCVSATVSQNYFNQYAGGNIFLYFILTKDTTKLSEDYVSYYPHFESFSKIAYSFAKTDESTSAEIFDSEDNQINEQQVSQYLDAFKQGEYQQVLSAIKDHLDQQENTKLNEILKNLTPETYQQTVDQIKNSADRDNLILFILEKKEVSEEVISYIISKEPKDAEKLEMLALVFSIRQLSSSFITPTYQFLNQVGRGGIDADKPINDLLVKDLLANLMLQSNTTPEILKDAYGHRNYQVISIIVNRQDCPPEIISDSIHDINMIVMVKNLLPDVASNPNTPVEELQFLGDLSLTELRNQRIKGGDKKFEAFYTQLYDHYLSNLRDIKEDIKLRLSNNVETPSQVLFYLAQEDNDGIKQRIARNPKLPVEAMKKLVYDSSEHVRIKLVVNPNLPEELLQLLAKDSRPKVKEFAQYRIDLEKTYGKKFIPVSLLL